MEVDECRWMWEGKEQEREKNRQRGGSDDGILKRAVDEGRQHEINHQRKGRVWMPE